MGKSNRGVLVIWLILATLGVVRTSAAEEPLNSSLVDYDGIRAAIPPATLERLVETIGLNESQRSAAADLVAAAQSDLARVVNRHLRRVRDDPSYSDIKSSEQSVVRDGEAVERQLMSDLTALLTPQQQEALPRFYRAHRRTLLQKSDNALMPMDIHGLLKKAGVSLDPNNAPEVSAVMSAYELKLDKVIVRDRRAWLAYISNIRATYDNSAEGEDLRRRIDRERQAASFELLRVGASVIEPLLELLPPAIGDRLAAESIRKRLGSSFPSLTTPQTWPVVKEVLAMELTKDQRGKAESLVTEAQAEANGMLRVAARDTARFDLADNEARAKYPTSPTNVYLQRASDARVRLRDQLLALLTSEQRNVYDASPVIDPADISKVND